MEGGTVNTAIETAFTGLAADLGATMGTIAVAAIGVYAIILGFRFAKKIFNQVAK